MYVWVFNLYIHVFNSGVATLPKLIKELTQVDKLTYNDLANLIECNLTMDIVLGYAVLDLMVIAKLASITFSSKSSIVVDVFGYYKTDVKEPWRVYGSFLPFIEPVYNHTIQLNKVRSVHLLKMDYLTNFN